MPKNCVLEFHIIQISLTGMRPGQALLDHITVSRATLHIDMVEAAIDGLQKHHFFVRILIFSNPQGGNGTT